MWQAIAGGLIGAGVFVVAWGLFRPPDDDPLATEVNILDDLVAELEKQVVRLRERQENLSIDLRRLAAWQTQHDDAERERLRPKTIDQERG